ncbi:hypothetical protein [uncultured Tateyamaria sp.]|uniref:hypothetical protein n=1 Tax=uncultured Tateyamaria sp. TaxID=455651 RepID=UPI002614D80C|nr:hypothetical protein [uncultured Tateyamaria sp.]
MMKPLAIALSLAVFGAPFAASAQETTRQPMPSAYFALRNQGGAFDFSEADWRIAVSEASERIYWKIGKDPTTMERVAEVAASVEGDPPFAWLFTVNLRPDQAGQFDTLLDTLVASEKPPFDGAETILRAPLCQLIRSAKDADVAVPVYYVATVEGAPERSACYTKVVEHVLDAPAEFQAPPLKQISIDGAALATQATMPGMIVVSNTLIVPDAWTGERQVVPRDSTTFAQGEMIMLHAMLDYVGRDLPGTPLASYEVRLDIELRDAEGNVIGAQNDAMRFTGQPIHSVPIRDDYWRTGVVTGFPLQEPGQYEIRYRLTDLNRPETAGQTEIIKTVLIE